MFQRSSASFATLFLLALSASVSATDYNISTRDDVIAADGFCSMREAFLAINTQRGYIGGVPSDERGVTLTPVNPNLTFVKEVRNVSKSGTFATAGQRLLAKRGELLEYRITITADDSGGDVTGVALAFQFPHEDPLVREAGIWHGYKSNYVAGSTLLNKVAVTDVNNGFPLATPLPVNDAKINDSDASFAVGKIRQGKTAEIIFRARVAAGDNEAVSEDLPEVKNIANTEYLVEAECPASSSANTVYLKSERLDSDEDTVVYELSDDPSAGTLVLGGGVDRDGTAVNPNATIEAMKEDAFDRNEKKNVEIIAPLNQRIFEIKSGSSLTVKNMTLIGSGPLPGAENGGLILARGNLELSAGTLLRGGEAESGGAVFIEGLRNLSLNRVGFENNKASDNGGAIATHTNFSGVIKGSRFHFVDNSATGDGGAIYLNGTVPSLYLDNGTFYGNSASDGAAIRIEPADRKTVMNNVTVVGNEAPAGAALSYQTVAPSGNDTLTNSAVLGNAGVDCAADDGVATVGSGLTLDVAKIAYVVSAGGVDTPSCGPLDEQYFDEVSGDSFDYSLVDFSLLIGADPAITDPDDAAYNTRYPCDAAAGASSCRPLTFDDGLLGFLPNNDAALAAPAAARIEPTLIRAGAADDALENICEPSDQRDMNRETRCDAGAIQLRIATGEKDEFRVVQGQESLLDVLINDMGDLEVDCNLATATNAACIGFQLAPRKTDVAPQAWIADGTIEVTAVHGRKGVYLNRAPDPAPKKDAQGEEYFEQGKIFPSGYPLVEYTPRATFHGVDQLRYHLDKGAVKGPTYIGADPAATSNLVVEPAAGMAKRKSIADSGSFSWLGLLFMPLLMLRRLRVASSWRLLLPLLLAFATQAQAADITVNTLLDSAAPDTNGFDSDKKCSLREALLVSIDKTPFFFPDCAPGQTGRDTIYIEVDGVIELEDILGGITSSVTIEGRGPGTTIIRPASGNLHRLFETKASLTLRNLTLEGGTDTTIAGGGAIYTTASLTLENVELKNNTSQVGGGAVFLNYRSGSSQTFTMRNSYAHGNQAISGNGGVLSMIGQQKSHDLRFEGVTFEGNTAPAGDGGALDVNLAAGGNLRVFNSTFIDNDALLGASLDLRQIKDTSTAYIGNSVFVDTVAPSAAAAVELGNDSGKVYMSNSIYLSSRACTSGSKKFDQITYNVFAGAQPASCDTTLPQGNVANVDVPAADILDVLSAGVVTAAQFVDDRYIPPHLPIVAEARNDAVTYPAGLSIIDAGNPVGLVDGDSTPAACRSTDLRGATRKSGEGCDIGAYQLQVATAIADTATNKGRSSRIARVDVLFNDLVGDGAIDTNNALVDSQILRGTIDLDPSNGSATPDNIIPVSVAGGATRNFKVSRVHDGKWQFTSSEVLEPGVYELGAVLYGDDDVFIANTRQTIVVRDNDPLTVDEDGVEFVSTGSSALQIVSIDGDVDADFILDNGNLVIHGRSDAKDGSKVQLYLDNDELGETEVMAAGGICGGEPGSADDDEQCIVQVEPDPLGPPLECSDLEDGGIEVVFPYRFTVFNAETTAYTPSTVAEVTVTINNVEPRLKGETIYSRPGRTEVFVLDITDADAANPAGELLYTKNAATMTRITLEEPPKFAAKVAREVATPDGVKTRFQVFGIEGYGTVDKDYGQLSGAVDPGLGLIVREDAGVISATYRPADSRGQFNDSFVLGYEDECGSKKTAQFKVRYPGIEDTTGSTGWLWLTGLMLLLGRVRRLRKL